MKRKLISCMAAAVVALTAVPAGITSNPHHVFACSKAEYTTPEYDYSVASQVFYGMATRVENVYYNGEMFRMATFVVDTNLKGPYTRTVLTRADSDQCGFAFEAGTNYLVFANNRQGYPSAGVFDIFTGDEAKRRLEIVKELESSAPVPEPGEHQITVFPGGNAKVELNGEEVPVKPGSLFYKDILYVPLTFFRDTLGYVTVWNESAKRYDIYLRSEWAGVAAQGDMTQAEFKSNAKGIPDGTGAFDAAVTYSDVQATVDGARYAPEHAPFNYDGVVFVPLRETAEKLGLQVRWDAESYIAQLKDTRPIKEGEHPKLVMKLSSAENGSPDLIVDRIENDQAMYHADQPLKYGETLQQFTAPFQELVQGRRIRLVLQAGERENELVVTEKLMNDLLTRPEARATVSLTLNREFYSWPDDHVINTSNLY